MGKRVGPQVNGVPGQVFARGSRAAGRIGFGFGEANVRVLKGFVLAVSKICHRVEEKIGLRENSSIIATYLIERAMAMVKMVLINDIATEFFGQKRSFILWSP